MSFAVRRANGFARKNQGQRTADQGRKFGRIASCFAQTGVPTPNAYYDVQTHEVVSPWVSGLTARQLLWEQPTIASQASSNPMLLDVSGHVAESLSLLHSIVPHEVALTKYNPWKRVLPRLTCPHELIGQTSSLYERLRQAESEVMALTNKATRSVHGDLHVGQIVINHGGAWLLDLDDAALGWPESDLANITAHLVTSRDLLTGDILTGFFAVLDVFVDSYNRVSQHIPNTSLLLFFGAASLLRRSLKLILDRNEFLMAQKATFACEGVADVLEERLRRLGSRDADSKQTLA